MMKKITIISIVSIVILAILTSCGSKTNDVSNSKPIPIIKETIKYDNVNYTRYIDESDIQKDFTGFEKKYSDIFSKYIQYITPNGKAIRIMAQDQITDEMLLRAYNILSFYLTSNENYDKTELSNKIAETGAMIVMPNGADGDNNKRAKKATNFGQPVYYNEAPVEGTDWYQNNDYEHRDAAFEEIFHFVHDYGIGTTQNPGVMPKLSKEIADGMKNVLPLDKSDWGKKGKWGLHAEDWLKELKKEGSLEQEYIVSGIDSYYGMWGAWTDGEGGMWGIYTSKNREDVIKNDPLAAKIIKEFLGERLTYMARIDNSFKGTFKMYFDEYLPYTHKSQYLVNVRLTGSNNSNIEGNEFDNILIGNSGDNIIDGKKGNDVVQFSGASKEYNIENSDGQVIVTDTKKRDGITRLKNIEILRFNDKDILI